MYLKVMLNGNLWPKGSSICQTEECLPGWSIPYSQIHYPKFPIAVLVHLWLGYTHVLAWLDLVRFGM